MAIEATYPYRPDSASPPGATLAELLKTIGMSQAELALRMGRPKKTISEIVTGKAALTHETALQLEKVLGVPATFWDKRESDFRGWLAREEENKRLEADADWVQSFPIAQMASMGWIDRKSNRVDQLRALLEFFGIASPAQFKEFGDASAPAFRRSPAFEASPAATAAWLREAQRRGIRTQCESFSKDRFSAVLGEARTLTRLPVEEFQPALEAACARAGVAFVLLPELKGTRVCGATQWLGPNKALLVLSLRYKNEGSFWFTFFHEGCHILRHGREEVFVEDSEKARNPRHEKQEAEADEFARDFLIPRAAYDHFVEVGNFREASVKAFAFEIGVTPGIVVGRLQYDRLVPYSRLQKLVRRFDWKPN